MAFWIDPILLVGTGIALAWVVKVAFDGNAFALYVGQAVALAATYTVAIGLFLNVPVLAPLWRALGAETGTAFMMNGWLFAFVPPETVWTDLGTASMFVAIVLFAVYPAWLRLGIVVGRLAFGRHARQEGLVGLARPRK